jgi:putative oxidoreductase
MFAHPIVILLARILLGGLFILASLDKIADPNAFATSILNYKVIGETLAMTAATILPLFELACGLLLILGIYPRTSALLITGLLAIFTVLVISAMARGLDISCGCFTQDPNASKIGYQKIFENTGMILVGIFLVIKSSPEFSILRLFSQRSVEAR